MDGMISVMSSASFVSSSVGAPKLVLFSAAF